MLLIAEIWLTIRAWRKGWKGWALLPAGCMVVLGLLVGVALGDTPSGANNLSFIALIIDLLGIVVLIVMNKATPEKKEKKERMLDNHVPMES